MSMDGTVHTIEPQGARQYHRPLPFAAPRGDALSTDMPEPLDTESIRRRIVELQLEHQGLDTMIDGVAAHSEFDELQLRRLKKRRLQIRDTIALLQMRLVPDVPA